VCKEDQVRIVECPKFGYGRELNPCLDCRIYSLRKAAEIMQEEGTRFVVTGEVLGRGQAFPCPLAATFRPEGHRPIRHRMLDGRRATRVLDL